MKAKDYIKEVLEIEVPETPVINGKWFAEKRLPMIVACVSCGMTVSLLSADIKTDGTIFCSSCAPDDLEYNEDMLAFEEEFNSDEDFDDYADYEDIDDIDLDDMCMCDLSGVCSGVTCEQYYECQCC